ncbi:MAG: hypothetical protein CVT80_00295 [Alphaproteobacteria bacterium HGW-Alphaproteobacteria-2]|nr:MAG: hypothetical protein CVT80_00295 [Alphaproteobacteria bacterium HGW-Alphaproteobacteria-2]
MVAEVIARLAERVPDLAGRIEGAAELSALMRENRLPQVTPAAHVLPLGLRGLQADAAAGLFRQAFDETVAVVLTWRGYEPTGGRALAGLEALIDTVIAALAGWAPAQATGVLRLSRGQLVAISAGTIVYQIDLTLTDHLRITP